MKSDFVLPATPTNIYAIKGSLHGCSIGRSQCQHKRMKCYARAN